MEDKKEVENNNGKLDINFENVDRFNKMLKVICIGIIIPIVLFIILVAIITIFILNMYWNIQPKESMLQHLESIYPDKYEIISRDIDEEGNGYYKIAIKDNKQIIFNGYHNGKNSNQEDSQAYKLKYYFEHLENTDLKEAFSPLVTYYKINEDDEEEFLKYELLINASSYNEFDEKILDCYKLLEYCKQNKIYGYTILFNCNNYKSGFGQNDENSNYQVLLDREKNKYIRYLVDNKLETKEIPNNDMEKIYRPEHLKIILNNQMLQEEYEAIYNDEIKEYEIEYFSKLVNKIDSIEKLQYNLYDSEIAVKIQYNNKIYKLHYIDNELKKDSIPYKCRISYLKEIFGMEAKYDYKNKSLNLIF